MALEKCKECVHEVSTDARVCPQCGADNPTRNVEMALGDIWQNLIILCFAIFVLGLVGWL